jgi:hypothetical protein
MCNEEYVPTTMQMDRFVESDGNYDPTDWVCTDCDEFMASTFDDGELEFPNGEFPTGHDYYEQPEDFWVEGLDPYSRRNF